LLTPNARLLGRIVLLGLFVLQVIGLTLRFDGASMTTERTWGYEALIKVHYLGSIATAVVTCLLIRVAARREGLPWDPRESFSRLLGFFLFIHIIGYCLFWAMTAFVFEGNTRDLAAPALVVSTWFACGLCWVVGGMGAALPPSLGRWALRTGLLILPVGIATAVAAVLAGEALAKLWESLGGLTFWSVYGLLRLIEPHVICDSSRQLLGTPRFEVVINTECFGYQGIGLVLTLLTFYLWCFRRTLILKRALVLLPVGVVAIWSANAVRIAALVWIGDRISPEVAVGGFRPGSEQGNNSLK
jgi:exosortase/archaeosortase family protein